MTSFIGKNILITGATGGLGRLLIKKLSSLDCHLIAIDIHEESLKSLSQELCEGRARISYFECDLNNISDLARIKTFCQSLLGESSVDILINNAGVVSGKSLIDLSDQEIIKTFNVNIVAPIILTRDFIKEMIKKDQGHIVNICSASSIVGVPKLSDYTASKAAILNFDESVRLELRKINSKVQTSAICPFYINTGMFDGVKTRFSWLLPILSPDYVVNRTLIAIQKNQRRIIMPWFVYSVFLIKVLPANLFDLLLSFFGINSSMDEFKGRGK